MTAASENLMMLVLLWEATQSHVKRERVCYIFANKYIYFYSVKTKFCYIQQKCRNCGNPLPLGKVTHEETYDEPILCCGMTVMR